MILGLSGPHALVKPMDRRWRKTKSVSASDRTRFIWKQNICVTEKLEREFITPNTFPEFFCFVFNFTCITKVF